ncbi:hypothetical protein [Thioalkalivibrio sulfidiphilus]|nr:hypothetical protein [Thioalkalivibrio sulfidiphilus]
MARNLTTSQTDRQNILNNRYAIEKVRENLELRVSGTEFEGEFVFTKMQVVDLMGIDERTVERYLSSNGEELEKNGYRVLKGKALKNFKLAYGADTDVGTKTSVLGVFSFRALLNIAMLVTESERARAIRSRILDVVIDVMAEKAGGHTRYINQRDKDYLPAAYQEFSYRRAFTDALKNHLHMGNHKYAVYTNKVYQAVFNENAEEYRRILKLVNTENPRDTMYAEVLQAIASFESGIAHELEAQATKLGRKLLPSELDDIIAGAENSPYLRPVLESARVKMASRDLCFRDALHHKLESYVQSVPESDFEKFLGETSKTLEERLSDPETLAVFKRLKDR